MICPRGHRVIVSSLPDPAGELHWTVVETPDGFRYAVGPCDELDAAPARIGLAGNKSRRAARGGNVPGVSLP